MTVHSRNFDAATDLDAISAFLKRHFLPGNRDGNWLQPVWEYAYTHPGFDESSSHRIGIWEKDGMIVGVVTYELRPGEAFFHTHPDYGHLKPKMLTYAAKNLADINDKGHRCLSVFVNDFDTQFEGVVESCGFQRSPQGDRLTCMFEIPSPFPPVGLPEGFQFKSLADDNDLRKVNRVLHRGFGHSGAPPEDGIEGCKKMQSGPSFRPDLTIVVEAPNGEFVSYAGLWLDVTNEYGYVEPVATDPDYRRRGLARAAVLEGIRRCGELGATVAYVGSDNPFYLSLGFRREFMANCWRMVCG